MPTGRAFAQDTSFFASQYGLSVATMQKFVPGDAEQLDKAVRLVKESLARILVILVFDSDMPTFIESGVRHGILEPGYVIISSEVFEPETVGQSQDAQWIINHMSCWFRVSMDAMYGAPGDLFDSVLHSEPIEHMQSALWAVDAETITAAQCQQYCQLIYDAVWTVAIAASRAELTADGAAFDKADLLRQLRGVSFGGESGQVNLDETTGEWYAETEGVGCGQCQRV